MPDERGTRDAWVTRVLGYRLADTPGAPLAAFGSEWAEAVATSKREAAALSEAIIAEMQKTSRDPRIVTVVRRERWPVLEAELDRLAAIIDSALTADAAAEQLVRAISEARAFIAGSPMLSTIDRNTLRATAVVARLQTQLGTLENLARGGNR